jgi:hypothetical protein
LFQLDSKLTLSYTRCLIKQEEYLNATESHEKTCPVLAD